MTWYIPSAGFFSKLLCSLLVVLIILQYIFGTVGHFNRRWDAMFYSAINTTRYANIYREAESRNDQVHWKAQEPYLELITNMNSNTSMNIAPITYYGNDSVPFGNVSIENFVSMPTCPPIPPNLHGRIEVKKVPVPLIKELETRFKWLKDGGHYAPSCITRSKIAIVVPYRARAEHLLLFLQHMHPFLKRQQIEYTIFIVEQNGDGPFNRAMLMNVGFKEALRTGQFDCFIFHDVDLLPEDDRNLYTCPEQPRHMSVAVDRFKYRLPYSTIFGGVSALTKDQFQTVNGFSNSFWGWGGEDDDMSNRIKFHNFHISRYPINIARYTMLTHQKEKANPKRYENLQQGKKKYNTDGLVNLKYEIVESRTNKLYTWFLVNLHKPS